MAKNLLKNVDKIILNTGNLLSLNDITKKPGQNTSEELIEAINITISEHTNGAAQPPEPDRLLVVNRPNDDLQTKIKEHDINDLKIGLKIFLNSDSQSLLNEAIDKAYIILGIDCVHDVIISFKQKPAEVEKANLEMIKNVWTSLEEYTKDGRIKQLGIADIEENTFTALYEWAQVKPSIVQINLATCCVVPPTLQAFCKEKEVKLLTHSDPNDILPDGSVEPIFGKSLNLKWVLRFLIHIKCRGVLTTKGYLLSLDSN